MIGSGGREHAICWKLRQSSHTSELHCAPGNAGIAEIATCHAITVNDPTALVHLATGVGADLTIIGPEAPLVEGVSDSFQVRGLRIVGPSRAAARLEGSKIFAKQFMMRHSIPTARFTIADSPTAALKALAGYVFPVVVKANGLAAGKGVRIVKDKREFEAAVTDLMVDRIFGEAGSAVVIEECLYGREASLMIITDGRDYQVLAPAQDYKRLNDGDVGPNTGGMGSFSTPGLVDDALMGRITREIIEPTLAGMAEEGNPFRGVLYAGLMISNGAPSVIEYNARLGDPETQAMLARLDHDLVEMFEATLSGSLALAPIKWSSDSSVCVVASSSGYPGEFSKGRRISGIDEADAIEGVFVFHAGTARDEDGGIVTAGGRVLGVTARASRIEEARSRAYKAMNLVSFEGIHYRHDIADLARTGR